VGFGGAVGLDEMTPMPLVLTSLHSTSQKLQVRFAAGVKVLMEFSFGTNEAGSRRPNSGRWFCQRSGEGPSWRGWPSSPLGLQARWGRRSWYRQQSSPPDHQYRRGRTPHGHFSLVRG
jgi:hypothetical protein